ncbi:pentatricopeptide repeat-containing protein At1g43980, mitochondrial isoform X2 [Andrographis paniculata]|uniref:pentatricopeptide repeat-containing protein At1g43980, mitochondrial isoform X2 n=1 Tax=Andrographis paniculata TaxID=175694 RepID=UPI0021E963B8|nr:pentatricopeptide repeat-containing protein At1g43980, mitochondrial isoform X2 [Andrographis paniculata]
MDGNSFSKCRIAMLDAYGKLGLVDYALAVFLSMKNVDLISWNSLISACCKSDNDNFAVRIFCLMISRGFKVDEYTVSAMLAAASNLQNLESGKQMFCLSVKMGFLRNTIVSSAAIDMFSKCNRMQAALCLFQESHILDSAICNSMIACYANHYAEENALELFVSSFREGIRPTEFTLSCIIHSAAELFPLEQGTQLHSLVVKTGLELDAVVASSLVNLYGKQGLIESATNIFLDMVFRDLIAWNTMLHALTHNGKFVEAIQFFENLLQSGLGPDQISFSGVLLACRYGRFIEEGMAFLFAMQKQYGGWPITEHYAYVVDMMIQAGRINEAVYLLHMMECEPNDLIWESILCACWDYGSAELIEQAANRMIELETKSSLPYLVLDKLYEKTGRWESLARVRRKMKMRITEEVVDCSWVGIRGHIYSFTAIEMIHYGREDISSILGLLKQEISMETNACFK